MPRSFGSSGNQIGVGTDGALELTGERSVAATPIQIVEDNGGARKKTVEQNGTKPLTIDSDSSVSTSVESAGSGRQMNSSMALYAEKAVKDYNRAVELNSAGFFDQAVAEYEEAIRNDDRMSEAYTNLGIIYASKQDYKKAIKLLSKSYELSPNNVVTMNAYVGALFNDGAKERAVELWKRAIKVDPLFNSARTNLADALEDMGRADDEVKKIRNVTPAHKRNRQVAPMEIAPVGDFDNGEIPLQYQPKSR
jgi:tetratricopeptide (TPR) repeat protein